MSLPRHGSANVDSHSIPANPPAPDAHPPGTNAPPRLSAADVQITVAGTEENSTSRAVRAPSLPGPNTPAPLTGEFSSVERRSNQG